MNALPVASDCPAMSSEVVATAAAVGVKEDLLESAILTGLRDGAGLTRMW